MLNANVKNLFIFSIFLYIFLLTARHTTADIFAERLVRNNQFKVITLDFLSIASYNQTKIDNLFDTNQILPNGYDIKSIRIKNESTQDLKYITKIKSIGNNDILCKNLNLEITDRTFKNIYTGQLLNMSLNKVLEINQTEDWIFIISLDNNLNTLSNKTCEFEIEIKSYRDESNESGGIYAKRIIRNTITSGQW